MTVLALEEMIDTAEQLVIDACRLGLSDEEARKLVRVEISSETRDRLFADWRPLRDEPGLGDALRRTKPIEIRGIRYYEIPRLTVSWRAIGLGPATRGLTVQEITGTV